MNDLNMFKNFNHNKNTMTDFLQRQEKLIVYKFMKTHGILKAYQVYNQFVFDKLEFLKIPALTNFLNENRNILFKHIDIKPINRGYTVTLQLNEIRKTQKFYYRGN